MKILLILLFSSTLIFGCSSLEQQVVTLVDDLSQLDGIAVGKAGELYVSDLGNRSNFSDGNIVWRIDADGSNSIVASGLDNPLGLAMTADGELLIAVETEVLRLVEGNLEQIAGDFSRAVGIAVDNHGAIYVTDYVRNEFRRIDTDGDSISVASQLLNGPSGIAIDENGDIYISNYNDGRIIRFTPDYEESALAQIRGGIGYLALAGENVYATGIASNRVYSVDMDGNVATLAGNGTPSRIDGDGDSASFNAPNGIAVTSDGLTLYVSEVRGKSIRSIRIAE